MRSKILLVVAAAMALAVAACADSSTGPKRPLRPEAGRHDEFPDSLGLCRAGFQVANGRCEPISG